jgi:hypothetical protein
MAQVRRLMSSFLSRGINGVRNSGRRWHRRIPPSVSRFRAALCFQEGLMTGSITRFMAPLGLFAMLSGCALTTGHPSVAELKYNPGRYQNRNVSIDGVVTSSWGVPLMPFKLYKVDDGTGEMTVLAQGGRVPTKGAHVRVKGRVNDVATFGGQSVGLHLEQRDLDFKRR